MKVSSKLPSKNSTTSNCPFVIVPVLSENKTFKEPAVSIPIGFLTNTLLSNIFEVFLINTIAIIKGKPSGTAITIIATAIITTFKTSCITGINPTSKYGANPPAIIIF